MGKALRIQLCSDGEKPRLGRYPKISGYHAPQMKNSSTIMTNNLTRTVGFMRAASYHVYLLPMKTLQFVCALIVCAVVALSAQTLPSGVKKMASMGGITEYDYSNGLKVLLYPDPAEPKITINVTYLVGSRHEGY